MATSTIHYNPVKRVINGGHKSQVNLDNRGCGWLIFDSMKKWSEKGYIAQVSQLIHFLCIFLQFS